MVKNAKKLVTIGPRAITKRPIFAIMVAAGISGLFSQSIQAQSVSLHSTNISTQTEKSNVHWLKMPTTPFLDVGQTANGSVDPQKMFAAWNAAGLSEDDAIQVIGHITSITPVIMGVEDAALEQQFIDEAQEMVDQLKSKFPDAHEKLQDQRVFTSVQWPSATAAWSGSKMDAPSKLVSTVVDMSAAKLTMELSVKSTGFHAVRIPWSNWESPQHIDLLAQGLEHANREISQATGLSGQVLGLSGRVEMLLGKITSVRFDGAEGHVLAASNGRLQLSSQWNRMAHEWFHAFDYVVGRLSSSNMKDTMSDQVHRHEKNMTEETTHSWSSTLTALEHLSPNWTRNRQQAFEKTNMAYWIDPSEGMAFAFSAYANRNYKLNVLADDDMDAMMSTEPFRSPSVSESFAQRPMWEQLFVQMKSLNITTGQPPDLLKSRSQTLSSDIHSRRSMTLR